MPKRKPPKRWQYTYSGWLRLFKCKEMSKEEERKLHDKLWNDKEFAEKIYKEYEDWQAEEGEDEQLSELEEKAVRRKQKGRRTNKGTFHGKSRGKYKERLPV